MALDLLTRGEIDVQGRLVDASNATLLATVTNDRLSRTCVYKPVAGERPLWDFPARTLARREVAAYQLSAATGWAIVPPTVLREGPFGPGSVQLWIDSGDSPADEPGAGLVDVVPRHEVPPGWLSVLAASGARGEQVALVHADDPRLTRMAVFDAVVNNADRKGGHVLRNGCDQVFGVDHGLTFNTEDKLRTVLWGWAGRRLPADIMDVLRALGSELDGGLGTALNELLSRAEVTGTRARIKELLRTRRFPRPGEGWPAIPWPPF